MSRERIAAVADVTWRVLLVLAVVMLAVAGIATARGADALSRFAGTTAWAAGLGGAVLGLLLGTGRRDAPGAGLRGEHPPEVSR